MLLLLLQCSLVRKLAAAAVVVEVFGWLVSRYGWFLLSFLFLNLFVFWEIGIYDSERNLKNLIPLTYSSGLYGNVYFMTRLSFLLKEMLALKALC